MLTNLSVSAAPRGDLQKLLTEGTSDHNPVSVSFAPQRPVPQGERPIKKCIFQSPVFATLYGKFLQSIPLDSLPVIARWETHKTILQEVARRTRNALIAGSAEDPEVRLLILNSVARAVCKCDAYLARALCDSSPTARRHLRCAAGSAELLDLGAFLAEIAAARNREFAAGDPDGLPRGGCANESKTEAMRRLSRLWSPFDKRLVLRGIAVRTRDGAKVARGRCDQLQTPKETWANVFAEQASRLAVAHTFARRWAAKFDFRDAHPPGVDEFEDYLLHVRGSAAGIDGLPYSAWATAGRPGAVTLALVKEHLRSG